MGILFKGVLCLFLGLSAGIGLAQTRLRAWNIHPDGYPVTEAMKSFAEQVNKATRGRYQIEVFSNAVLGDQPKAVQMLKSGEIDLAEFNSAPLSEAVPGIKALNLPFLFRNSAHMFEHLDGKLGEHYAANLKEAGFVVLGWYDGGARSFYCTGRTVTSFRDLAGARIRVQNSEVYTEMVRLLAARPVTVPFKEVLDSLQQAKIDCAENNMPSYESTGHYTVAKSVYLTNHVISPEALVVSTQLWDRLSSQDKTLFAKAGAQSALLMRELWKKRVAQAMDTMSRQGVQFVSVKDPSYILRRMTPLYGRYMSDLETRQELLTIISK